MTPITRFDRLVGSLVARHRDELNEASAAVCAVQPRAAFVPFDQSRALHTNRDRTFSDYRDGAELLADLVVPALEVAFEASGRIHSRILGMDEAARQLAVDELNILDSPAEERFDRIVSFAQRAFQTSYAAITIIDNDRQWQKSAVGLPRGEMPREYSICATTILQSGALIVEDTAGDIRFPEPPPGSAPVRFYAGFPIEAPAGERIGALCVLDTAVRSASTVDRALLRDLALMVQREVWRGDAA
jgi:GAF domain-containing protein